MFVFINPGRRAVFIYEELILHRSFAPLLLPQINKTIKLGLGNIMVSNRDSMLIHCQHKNKEFV